MKEDEMSGACSLGEMRSKHKILVRNLKETQMGG
jgi:hypothetical protein